jgi:hypothetical protein
MNKIVRFFPHADLRCQHDGLISMALKHKVNVLKLKPGEHAIFVNNAWNKLKMFSSGGVLSYLRLRTGRIDPRSIQHIPDAFQAGSIAYKGAIKKTVLSKLASKPWLN